MLKTLLVFLCMLNFISCSQEKGISVPEAMKLIDSEKFIFLDAREINEHKVSRIKGARFVGYENFNLNKENFDSDKIYIVYCSVGKRSLEVVNQLTKAGFNALNLEGGLFAWSNSELPLFNSSDNITKKIHGYNREWSKKVLKGEVILDE
jgi:rhodanese-related sulfurtransferase